MDELSKDMSLCSTPVSLQSFNLHSPAAHPYRGAVYLQDYLAGANSVPQPPRTPPPPPPHTALSLEFTYLGSAANSAATSSGDDPGHFGFSLSGGNNSGRRSAALQPAAEGGDRRQRRMIKNRESAARSRARKQAYTNELELELEQLRRENMMLIQREKDFINDRQAKAAQLAVPDCPSRRSTASSLQQKQLHPQRCRSAPPP
ncbi:Protein FD [Hordeum vulgare]|nr:Protein FD [Hordeum vulgare]